MTSRLGKWLALTLFIMIVHPATLASANSPKPNPTKIVTSRYIAPYIAISHTRDSYRFAFPKIKSAPVYKVDLLDAVGAIRRSFTFAGGGVKIVPVSIDINWPTAKIKFFDRNGRLRLTKSYRLPIYKSLPNGTGSTSTKNHVPSPATLFDPTPAYSPTPSSTPSPVPSATPSPTPTASATQSPTPTASATQSPTPTASATPSPIESSAPATPPEPIVPVLALPAITLSSHSASLTISHFLFGPFPNSTNLYVITNSGGSVSNYYLASGDAQRFHVDPNTGGLSLLQHQAPSLYDVFTVGIGARNASGSSVDTIRITVSEEPLIFNLLLPSSSGFTNGSSMEISWESITAVPISTPVYRFAIPSIESQPFSCVLSNVPGGQVFISGNELLPAAPIQPPGVTFTVKCVVSLGIGDIVEVTNKNFSWIVPAPTGPPVAASVTIRNLSAHTQPQVGDSLAAIQGRILSGGPANVAYQWLLDTTKITSATSQGYQIQVSDIGHSISVQTTYMNGISPDFVETSTATLPVIAVPSGPTATALNIQNNNSHSAPRVGDTLTLIGGVITSGAPATTTYLWLRDSSTIPNETSTSYTVQGLDVGHIISTQATFTNGFLPDLVETATIGTQTVSLPSISNVTISGENLVGAQLTVNYTLVDGYPAPHVSYQWYRSDTGTPVAIASATDETYTTTSDDIGFHVTVEVKASSSAGDSGAIASTNSIIVNVPLPPISEA